ncbi:hypothetical protein [Streptomyces sp. HB132]|uniref:hypothetical protein n=1 Tax=Streptomyces sp. HB132 TaxID=767388 RepID=UPI001960480D|nr:hypothetical protein [Streptomyces sp. HB132]MBM7440941.1 hypothetical protein [Streptomyces sp. HB132]
MTDTEKYAGPDASPMDLEISIRDDATQADRENAERSVAALVERSASAVARERASEAEMAELTAPLDAPLMKLIEGDPSAVRALERLRSQELVRPDAAAALGDGGVSASAFDTAPMRPHGAELRSLGFVPPYDFSWAWHDGNGHPPFSRILDRSTGDVGLDARSGLVAGGASGFVNAHAGFGVFLRSDTPGQRFPHAVLNPGRFSHVMKAVGVGSNATSEGGFELTVFEDGRLLAAVGRKLWRARISAGESSSGGQGPFLITGPELQFTLQPGRGYTFNAGIWVYSDRSTGIGGAAVQSLLQGVVTRMWVFG